jgi:hypothetical protein
MSDNLFFHPELLAAIKGELRRGGCRPEWVDDRVPDVVAQVWKYLHEHGEKAEDLERLKAIARPVAYRRGVDDLRNKYDEKKAMEHAADEAAAKAAPDSSSVERQLDAKKALEIIAANQEGHDAAIIEGLTGGKSQKAVGEELKLSHDQARKATGSMRERHGGLLSKAGYVLAGVALAVLIVFFLKVPAPLGGPNVGKVRPDDSTELPAPPRPPLTPDQKKLVADLRALGHAKAQEKDWKTCWTAYFAAENIDAVTPQAAVDEATMCKQQLDKGEGRAPQ